MKWRGIGLWQRLNNTACNEAYDLWVNVDESELLALDDELGLAGEAL